jgi:hypothetical protein
MSDIVADLEIRDTNTYERTSDSGATQGRQLFHVVNGLDAEVTVTVYGTRDEDRQNFSDAESLGTLTIASSSTGYETLSDPWEEVQFETVASSTPSSGSLQIYEMK